MQKYNRPSSFASLPIDISLIHVYRGLHLDNKLNWKDHIIKKRKNGPMTQRTLLVTCKEISPISRQ